MSIYYLSTFQHFIPQLGRAANVVGGVSVYPFGSSVNGLGFRACDLDIYVEMGEWKKLKLNARKCSQPIHISDLRLRKPLHEYDDHALSVEKVKMTAQVLRTIPQVNFLQQCVH